MALPTETEPSNATLSLQWPGHRDLCSSWSRSETCERHGKLSRICGARSCLELLSEPAAEGVRVELWGQRLWARKDRMHPMSIPLYSPL